MRKAFLGLVIIGMAMAGPAVADPIGDGVIAYNRKDFETALRLLLPLAEKGNALSQYMIGFMYSNGLGVPQ